MLICSEPPALPHQGFWGSIPRRRESLRGMMRRKIDVEGLVPRCALSWRSSPSLRVQYAGGRDTENIWPIATPKSLHDMTSMPCCCRCCCLGGRGASESRGLSACRSNRRTLSCLYPCANAGLGTWFHRRTRRRCRYRNHGHAYTAMPFSCRVGWSVSTTATHATACRTQDGPGRLPASVTCALFGPLHTPLLFLRVCRL
ncbi:uncharacterized protein LY79DRAFT_144885 [Colletotrichum navitas]|uniref:Uncharacterized protein n=1 Tax=Colletotrichum navitas TaxID=681940 RepID=A0AAD8QEE9_9PEZI|nr:uncharacterized protein LY79DRAFT_144885 [Colletotrichum navitas]KAK1599579.1 hypothetical protein LY79DRAFT_144885 [Colletotrichum navitas]